MANGTALTDKPFKIPCLLLFKAEKTLFCPFTLFLHYWRQDGKRFADQIQDFLRSLSQQSKDAPTETIPCESAVVKSEAAKEMHLIFPGALKNVC